MEGRVYIVLAAYDEEAGLDRVLPEIPSALCGLSVEIVVVSDGSSDGTAEVAARHGADVIRFDTNRGKGAAVRAGIRHARASGFDVLVTMDADGQHDAGDLASLVEPVVGGVAAVAYGSRYLSDPGRHGVPFNRYVVRRATVAILKRLLAETHTDPYCGFRAFSDAALDAVEFAGDRYEGELEAIFDAHRHGLSTVEVPVARIYRAGTSKMGARRGRLLGRVLVLSGYARTILRKARELRKAGAEARPAPAR